MIQKTHEKLPVILSKNIPNVLLFQYPLRPSSRFYNVKEEFGNMEGIYYKLNSRKNNNIAFGSDGLEFHQIFNFPFNKTVVCRKWYLKSKVKQVEVILISLLKSLFYLATSF